VKTPPFEYHAPESLEEVLALVTEYGDEAKVLAGGQSLMPLLAMRFARPGHLVDLNGISGLDGIEDRGDRIVLGALVRERAAERSVLVGEKVPVMSEALPLIGHIAIRNRGTVGGSIAHADASAELPAVALLTEAEMLVRSARGERIVSAEGFFQGHFTTVLEDDECLVEVRIPPSPAHAGWCCLEIARRHGDFALVGAAAMVGLDDSGLVSEARISLFGVADRPLRAREAEAALVGNQPSAEVFAAAGAEASSDLEPASDVHGSAAVRRHLAKVTVRRALERAASRAGGK
jgi:carbon-monoxide dehydrogenase medium subunit